MSDVAALLGELGDEVAKQKDISPMLAWVSEQVKKIKFLEQRQAELEKHLDEVKDQLSMLVNSTLPAKFLEFGITELTCEGTKVKIETFYQAKIPEGRESEAFSWLEEHNQDAIIKSKIEMDFGKGEQERKMEEDALRVLKEAQIRFNQKRGIHPQTLKSFVKNALEEGQEIPKDLFGVYIGQRAKIK